MKYSTDLLRAERGSFLQNTSTVGSGSNKLISIPQKKAFPSNYLPGNSYSPSTHLLVNKYSLQEISTPLETVWCVVFSHLNTPGSSIFLVDIYSPVKPLY